MRLNGQMIYKSKIIEIAVLRDSYYINYHAAKLEDNTREENLSETQLRDILQKLYDNLEVTDPNYQVYVREFDNAHNALEEYLMFGNVKGRTMSQIFSSDEDSSEGDITSDEAQLRLENVVKKRPSCYGSHPANGDRNSRCLICEHEHGCIDCSKKLKSAKTSNTSTKKSSPKKTNVTANNKEDTFMRNMENLFKEFYPSEVPSGEVAMTMYGQLAVRRKDGSYVRYNNETGQIENQMNMVISSDKLDKMYLLMPTPIMTLESGDIIKEKETYYQIIELTQGKIKAANLSTGTESSIKIETNILTGQKMYRKVFSFFSMAQQAGNPMVAGMMNPMMLMMMDSMGESADDTMKTMAMMSMMPQMMGGQPGANFAMNPMMMYMMMGDSKGGDNDWMKMMAMSTMMQQFTGASNNMFGFPMQQVVAQQAAPTSDQKCQDTEHCCGNCRSNAADPIEEIPDPED